MTTGATATASPTPTVTRPGGPDLGPARHLSCRECGADQPSSARSTPAASASARSRSAYEFGAGHPRVDRGRPAEHLALPGPAAGARRRCATSRTSSPAARRWCRRTTSPASSGMRALWVKDDSANPTHSFKDRVVARRAGRRPRARLHHAGLPVDRQPGQRRRRRRGPRRHPLGGARPGRPRAAEDRHHRGLRRRRWSRSRAPTTTSTGSPPSWPASTRTGRSSTSTSGPTTPRAPRPWATRSPSSSAGGCPSRS